MCHQQGDLFVNSLLITSKRLPSLQTNPVPLRRDRKPLMMDIPSTVFERPPQLVSSNTMIPHLMQNWFEMTYQLWTMLIKGKPACDIFPAGQKANSLPRHLSPRYLLPSGLSLFRVFVSWTPCEQLGSWLTVYVDCRLSIAPTCTAQSLDSSDPLLLAK